MGASREDFDRAFAATEADANAAASDARPNETSRTRSVPPLRAGPTDASPLVGRLVDHFRVDELLGQGGMGAVYRAWDTSLFRPVALKTLLVDSETARARFMREARSQARIRHPNVVTIHAVGEVDGCVYLVMDLVEGEPLDERIARSKRLVEDESLAIVDAVAGALEAAHGEGLIHRDIKPANILVERSGRVLLADFGLAKALAADALREEHRALAMANTLADEELPNAEAPHAGGKHVDTLRPVARSGSPPAAIVRANELAITRVGGLVGSPFYMAPEQFRGEPCDHRADMYALGATLFELLTGHPPLTGTTLESLAVAVQTQPPRFPDKSPARHRTRAFVLRLLEKSADDRFADYGALRREIAHLRRSPPPRAPLTGRVVAFLIDVALGWAVVGALGALKVPPPVGWLVASAAIASLETRWGRSIGKRALQLDVVMVDGGKIGWRQAAFRGFFRLYLPVLGFVCFEAANHLAPAPREGIHDASKTGFHWGLSDITGLELLFDVTGLALLMLWVVTAAFVVGPRRATLYDRWTRTTIVTAHERPDGPASRR